MRALGRILDMVDAAEFQQRLILEFNQLPKLHRHIRVWNPHARFVLSNRSAFDDKFPRYNAVQIPELEYVLAEGPDQTDPHAANVFLASTLANQRFPIKCFIVVGDPAQSTGFTDYFSSHQIQQHEFLNGLFSSQSFLTSEATFTVNDAIHLPASQFNFYQLDFYDAVTQQNYTGYVLHVPQWLDHQIFDFAAQDKLLLTLIALFQPRLLAHCSAGLGRSVTLLAGLSAFCRGIHLLDNAEDVLSYYLQQIQNIRSVRPCAMYNVEQCMMGLRLAGSMAEFYLQHQMLFAAVGQKITATTHHLLPEPAPLLSASIRIEESDGEYEYEGDTPNSSLGDDNGTFITSMSHTLQGRSPLSCSRELLNSSLRSRHGSPAPEDSPPPFSAHI